MVGPKSETIWFHMGANGTESESETYAQRLALSKRGPQAAQPPKSPLRKNYEKGEFEMSEREFNLSERAEALDMELRRDDDGLYWLDFVGDPSMRSIGPLDLDEVEARIDAAENRISRKAFEDGAEAQK